MKRVDPIKAVFWLAIVVSSLLFGRCCVRVLNPPAEASSVPEIWGGSADSVTVIPVTFTNATGALVATDAPPTITIQLLNQVGAPTTIVNGATMTAGAMTGTYFYRFVTTQTDSAGVLYVAQMQGAVGGVTTGIAKVFRRSDLRSTVALNLDAAVSSRSTLSASDNIGINWGDVANQGATVALTATTVNQTNRMAGDVQTLDTVVDFVESQRGFHTWQGNVFYVGPTTGSDVTGDGSRGNPYATVTKALTQVTDRNHDIIFLVADNTAGQTILDEQVTITGSHDFTFIRGPGPDFLWKSTAPGDVITLNGASGIGIAGFELQTHTVGTGDAIKITGSSSRARVHHMYITYSRGDAIEINGGSLQNRITDNFIYNVGEGGAGDGIRLEGSGQASEFSLIARNDICDVAGDGIVLQGALASHNHVYENIISNCTGYGISAESGAAGNTIAFNSLTGNTLGQLNNPAGSDLWNNDPWASADSLAVAQVDLDNPNQYKATGFAVAGDAMALTVAERSAVTDSLQAEAADFRADVSMLVTSAALAVVQADLDNPSQYQATGFAVPGSAMALTAAERAATADSVWGAATAGHAAGTMGDSLLSGVGAAGVLEGSVQVGMLDVHPPGQTLFLTASYNSGGVVGNADTVQYSVHRDGVAVVGWTTMPQVGGITGFYGVSYTLGVDGTYTVLVRATLSGQTTQGLGAFVVHRGRFLRR